MRSGLKRYGEVIVTGVILVVTTLLLLFMDTLIPTASNRVSADILGTKFWPRVILGSAILLTIALLVKQIKVLMTNEVNEEEEKEYLAAYTDFRLISLMVITTLYIVLLPYLGFILLTPIYLILFCYLIGITKLVKNVLFSLGLSAIMIYLFGKFLYVPLPRGIGAIREFSFLFY